MSILCKNIIHSLQGGIKSMSDYKARVRKLLVSFNTLPDKSKNMLLERMEELRKEESIFTEKGGSIEDFADISEFSKVCGGFKRTSI